MIYQLPDELIRLQRGSDVGPDILVGRDYEEWEVPDDIQSSADPVHYHGYREGKVSHCVDVVAYSFTDDGTPGAIMTFRGSGVCFEKKWWMQGGALSKAASEMEFVARCGQKESGSLPRIEALVGVFRTSEFIFGPNNDMKRQISTVETVYIGFVPPEHLKLRADENHTNAVLMTKEMYAKVPEEEKHWYPTRLLNVLFRTMP